MTSSVATRPVEARAIDEFLAEASGEPSALLLEGVAGIGKTTLWMAAVDQAMDRGFRVLSARPTAAESVLAYASLADMLAAVEPAVWASLPRPQRVAVDRMLLRTGGDGSATDPRAVAAGFLSVITKLTDESPVLLAIDDMQWLDTSTAHALAFAARRFPERVGLLATVRADPESNAAVAWLQLPRPQRIRRVHVGPLTLGALHAVVTERLNRRFSRPTMVRIHQVSGGNPFYAVELARAIDVEAESGIPLPDTLSDVVRVHVGKLDANAHDLLLTAACLAAPTVEVVARAAGVGSDEVVGPLEQAEDIGIIAIEGRSIRFAHPLFAHAVYTEATAARRRATHRRLADIVEDPELRARHLALAAVTSDEMTLRSLDAAAELARNRGAPTAAAELLELAVGLGGDTAERRIRLAGHHFHAGDNSRARAQLERTIGNLEKGPLRAQAQSLLASLYMAVGSFVDAAEILNRALGEVEDNLALRVEMLVMRSFALLNADLLNVEQYVAAARSAEDAVTTATQLGQPHLLSQALGTRALQRFLRGEGFDQPSLQRAVDLEDRDADIALALRPSMHNAVLLAWTGQLERACEELRSIRQRCIEHGQESEMMLLAVHSVQTEIWRGNFTEATAFAEEAVDRALQLGDDMALFVARAGGAACAAYTGRVDRARRDISEALAASERCATRNFMLWVWVVTTAGFLEVSLGNYDAAVTALEPLLSTVEAAPRGTEVFLASFVPDAVEAMIALGRLDEAEPLVEALERNGARLDRAWMLAVGARGRAMLLADRGDLDAAMQTAQRAMAEHDRLPMPFERARTQLLLGQLLRRQRKKDSASAALREALAAFESMGTLLWANRVRAELARAKVGRATSTGLTPSEKRVAELAASGMKNRDVAATLFISPKTVEVNLYRIYRKLGIRSRAELGRYISELDR
jgi:DNA-binding CsgD family transcriptional regulator